MNSVISFLYFLRLYLAQIRNFVSIGVKPAVHQGLLFLEFNNTKKLGEEISLLNNLKKNGGI